MIHRKARTDFITCSHIIILILALSLLWPSLTIGGSTNKVEASWSSEAIPLFSSDQEARKLKISSPDKQKTVIVGDINLQVIVNGSLLPGTENEGVETLAELAWAPDSNAFYITASDGGNVGTWYVRVYLIEKAMVRRVDISQEVEKRFEEKYTCEEPEEPNIAAIKWLKASKTLLLVAEVLPHSSCPDMGMKMGYIVSIPGGEIVQEFSEKKLKANWGQYVIRGFNNE